MLPDLARMHRPPIGPPRRPTAYVTTTAAPPVAAAGSFPVAGIAGGIVAVASWGGYLALARAGVAQGLTAGDFLVLRFVVAALFTTPLVLWRRGEIARLGLLRSLALTLVAGPVFTFVGVTGFAFAPLAHGALIQPSVVTLGGIVLGAVLLGERITPRRAVGGAAVLAGVALIGGAAFAEDGGSTGLGDLCFAAAGASWLAFTLLLRHWRVDPVAATAVVNGLSAAIVLPVYALTSGFGHLMAFPAGVLAVQALVQGVLSGGAAVVGYAYAVRQLGAGRAALFPALVPATATVIGIPAVGEIPTPVQVLGLGLATLGLVLALRGSASSPIVK